MEFPFDKFTGGMIFMNMNMDDLYQSLKKKLEKINSDASSEEANWKTKAEGEVSRINAGIAGNNRAIQQLTSYQNTASAHIDDAVRRQNIIPKEVTFDTVDNLYKRVSSQKAGWDELYITATAGIMFLRHVGESLEREKRMFPGSFSNKNAENACSELLKTKEFADLLSTLKESERVFSPADLVRAPYKRPDRNTVVPFYRVAASFPVTDGCLDHAERIAGRFFDRESRGILMPRAVSDVVLIQTRSDLTERAMEGVRAYLIELLCLSVPVEQMLYYIDTRIYDESALGGLTALIGIGTSVIAPVAKTVEEARKQLAVFHSRAIKKEGRRVLVFRYQNGKLDGECETELNWLCANAEHYGFQVIIVREFAQEEDIKKQGTLDFIPDRASKVFTEGQCFKNKKGERIAWNDEPKRLPIGFVRSILDAYAPQPLETRYFEACGIPYDRDYNLEYKRNRKRPVSLLYGVDEDENKYTLDLTGMDFAAFIMGASRSGKSNLLNILITSAVLNYHPDDLELWLVDFGRTEFHRYVEHTPPHVRCVLVEKTRELVCSLVKALVDELEHRLYILSRNNAQKIDELPESVHMPRLLVLIDEFSAFKEILVSDSFENKSEYRQYMSRLLKQGAKTGMCFVFSDQSFSDNYRALPDEAQQQIGLRLAMLNDQNGRAEMKEVLGVRTGQLTAAEEDSIRKLPKYQVLYCSNEGGGTLTGPVHVLYFDNAAKERQLKIFDVIRGYMRPGDKDRNSPWNNYRAHEQLLLDRDARPGVDDVESKIGQDIGKWKQNPAAKESDLLLYLGQPCTMQTVRHELLRERKSANVLVYGDYAKDITGMAELVWGTVRSAQLQNFAVEFWCDEDDSLMKSYIKSWKSGELFTDRNKISERIRKTEESIQSREEKRRLIIVTGLSDMISEIEADIEEKLKFGGDGGVFAEKSKFGGTGGVFAELSRAFQELDAEGTNVDGKENMAAGADADEEPFDIIESLKRVLGFGPRHGTHFIVLVQREQELDDIGVGTELFSQIAAFPSGTVGMQSLRLRRLAGNISEGGMFGYDAGDAYTTYIPFLKKR